MGLLAVRILCLAVLASCCSALFLNSHRASRRSFRPSLRESQVQEVGLLRTLQGILHNEERYMPEEENERRDIPEMNYHTARGREPYEGLWDN